MDMLDCDVAVSSSAIGPAPLSASPPLTLSDDIPASVAANAIRTPDRPFLILERQGRPAVTITFRGLIARAEDFAAAYRARGLGHGSLVAIMLVTHADLAPAFLGAMIAGLVPSVFPPLTPKADPLIFYPALADMFARINPSVIVTDPVSRDGIAAYLPDFEPTLLLPDAIERTHLASVGASACASGPRAPDGIAFLQHSSGTTGTKKGVVMTHRATLDFAASLSTALGVQSADIIASWLPLYHDMGLIGCLVLPMVLGLTVVQLDPFEWVAQPATLLNAIQSHRATLCWMPNFAFHHIVRVVRKPEMFDLSSMRAFIDCSEPCKPETLSLFGEHFAASGLRETALQVSYGMAENVFIATQTDMALPPQILVADREFYAAEGLIRVPADDAATVSFVSVGRPIPGTRLRILDAEGVALADRHVGQIAITSPYLFQGYYRRETPPGVLSDGWYMSGDLGFTIDGNVFVSGRLDDLMIINGRNIYAHDVEYAVNQQAAVKPGRCVAIAPYNKRLGSRSLVVIAETEDADPEMRLALARRIRAVTLATFGVAAYDVRTPDPGWMVKTTSGKVSRGGNEAKYRTVSSID